MRRSVEKGELVVVSKSEDTVADSETSDVQSEDGLKTPRLFGSSTNSGTVVCLKEAKRHCSHRLSHSSSECVGETSSDDMDEGQAPVPASVSTVVIGDEVTLSELNSFDERAKMDSYNKERTFPTMIENEIPTQREHLDGNSPNKKVVSMLTLTKAQVYELRPDHVDQRLASPSFPFQSTGDASQLADVAANICQTLDSNTSASVRTVEIQDEVTLSKSNSFDELAALRGSNKERTSTTITEEEIGSHRESQDAW